MAAILVSGTKGAGTGAAGATRYWAVAAGNSPGAGNNSNQADVQLPMRTAGTFSKMFAYFSANSIAATSTFTFQVGTGTNGNQTITLGSSSGATEIADSTHNDAVTVGMLVNAQSVTGGSSNTLIVRTLGFVFAATTNTVQKFGGGTNPVTPGSVNTVYIQPINGSLVSAIKTETDVQHRFRTAGTLRNLCMDCTAFSFISGGTVTVITHLNGTTNGNQTITFSTTGRVEDSTHNDAISTGDKAVLQQTNPNVGSGSITFTAFSLEFETTTSTAPYLNHNSSLVTINVNTNVFLGLNGDGSNSATETDYQTNARTAATLSNLQVYVSSNTLSVSATGWFRKTAGNGNQTFTILTTDAAKFIEDATHNDTVVDGNECDYEITSGAGGGSVVISELSTLATVSAPGSGTARHRVIGG